MTQFNMYTILPYVEIKTMFIKLSQSL